MPKSIAHQKGLIRAASWLLFLAFFAGACGSANDGPQRAREIVSVAVLGRLSGEDAAIGASVERGVQLAVDEYNAHRDSTYKAQISRADGQGSPEGTTAAVEAIKADERIIGVIGPFHAADAAVAGPILEEAQIPFLLPSVPSNEVPDGEWKAFRRLTASSHREGAVLAEEAMKLSPEALAIFHDASPSGGAFAQGAQEAADKAQRGVARNEAVGQRADLKALATSVTGAPPGAVLFGGSGRAAQFFTALRAAGFQGQLLGSHEVRADPDSAGVAPPFLSAAPEAFTGDPALRAFTAKHKKKYRDDVQPFEVEAYEGTLMLLESIQEVLPRPRDIVDFLRLNPGFLGDSKSYEYEPTGELKNAPVWLYELRDGAWRYSRRSDAEARRRPGG